MERKALLRHIRGYNLLYWAELFGRETLALKAGDNGTNLLNQLVTMKGSFGDKVAERYESALDLPPLWLDIPHLELWTAQQRAEMTPHLSPVYLTNAQAERSTEAQKVAIKEALSELLELNHTKRAP